VRELEGQMKNAARDLEFERAAALRDQIVELRRELIDDTPESLKQFGGGSAAPAPSRPGRGRTRSKRMQK
jgi:excinuclease ABC subunit B